MIQQSVIAPLNNQRGVVLIASLLILLLLTLLGLTAMQTTTLEEKMAGNTSDRTLAFQAAEAALRDAEIEIEAGTRIISKYTGPRDDPDFLRREIGSAGFSADCTNGLCYNVGGAIAAADWQTLKQNALRAGIPPAAAPIPLTYVAYSTATASADIAGVAAQPRYIIDYSCVSDLPGASNCLYTYVVTVLAFGARTSTQVTLEGVYRTD